MRALRTTVFAAACLALLTGPAFADKIADEIPDESAGPNCDVTGYKTERQIFSTPVPIPDNVAAGVTVGPIFMPPDGDIINDVVLELKATHTWLGDLILTLSYDPDCDGPAAAIPARVLCRQRGTNAASPPPCGTATGTFGCSADFVAANTYSFSDDAAAPMAEGACGNPVATGCYKQTSNGGQAFSIWRGLPKGGCWSMNISDNAGADTGAIQQWAVHVRNQRPVPAEVASWGQVKGIYR